MQVKVYPNVQPEKAIKTYCCIDDQSNRSLARSKFFDISGEQGLEIQYTLLSCSGTHLIPGRRASTYTIESLDGQTVFHLPTLIECNKIPDNKDEIPKAEVARCYLHLQDLAQLMSPINFHAKTLFLLGRYIISVHYVHDQRINRSNSPYGQKISLGWVIVGETCIGRAHKSNQVNVNKTFIIHDGKPSLHPSCINNFHVRESNLDALFCEPDNHLFIKTQNDNKPGKSIEDRQFETIMEAGLV